MTRPGRGRSASLGRSGRVRSRHFGTRRHCADADGTGRSADDRHVSRVAEFGRRGILAKIPPYVSSPKLAAASGA